MFSQLLTQNLQVEKDPQQQNNSESTIFRKNVHVYSHLDADGLSSAAILLKVFQRLSIGCQLTILKQVERRNLEQIKEEIKQTNKLAIFSDFGSGQIQDIKGILKKNDYLVLDHHKPQIEGELTKLKPQPNHVNPYFYGINGSIEICGAGVCYLFAKTVDKRNKNLAIYAIMGALGDLQNKGKKGTFLGLNKEILKDAIETGGIKTETNLAIARNEPIAKALAYTLKEQIPGISGDEIASHNFLEGKNIRTTTDLDEKRTLMDLSDREKKALNTGLVQYAIIEKGMDASIMNNLITTNYVFQKMNFNGHLPDGKEIRKLLNACGRTNHPSLGLAIMLGDSKAYEKVKSIIKEYKKAIQKGARWGKNNLKEKSHVRVLYGGDVIDDRKIGTVISIILHSEKYEDKPIIGYAKSDHETYKISSRAHQSLIKRGLDLGEVMRNAVRRLNIDFQGGGHPPAAGAKVPIDKIKPFLKFANEEVEKML